MTELAYVNGVFSHIDEARISINDRGFQFGDGIYEVVAAYGGRPFLMREHMRRLRRSAAAIALDLDRIPDPLEPAIMEGIRRSDLRDCLVYIQVTRGVAPRSHTIPDDLTPTVVMTFRPLPSVSDEHRRRGASVMTIVDKRWSNCYVKAVTLLPNVLAKREAQRNGYDDAIFVTESGEVRECTAANVFIAHGESLVIPPRTESILHGVTQGFLLDCASTVGITVTEQVCTLDQMRAAREVFMSGTTVEALAITRIDGAPVGDGTVGPMTQRLYDEFAARLRAFAAGEPVVTPTNR